MVLTVTVPATDRVRVTLRPLAGAAKELIAAPEQTMWQLKESAAALFRIATDELTLISGGRRLGEIEDDETVADMLWLPLGAVDP